MSGLVVQMFQVVGLLLVPGMVHTGPAAGPSSRNTRQDCSIATSGAYIAISSEAEIIDDSYSLRWLEMIWFGLTNSQEDDYVGLWMHEPSLSESPIEFVSNYGRESGTSRTHLRWDGSLLPNKTESLRSYCLPYWVGVVKGGELVYSSCLKLNSNWMMDNISILKSVNLTDVVLPGTHYAWSSSRIGITKLPNIIESYKGIFGIFWLPITEKMVGTVYFSQDENLWGQLIMGSRYLDMVISYYDDTEEKFFVDQGEMPIIPLIGYINDIAAFMKQTQEIVIFDIHSLPVGFSEYPERYLELIEFLTKHLGEVMTPRSLYSNPTLGEIWESGRRLIVTFPSEHASDHPYLWDQVDQSSEHSVEWNQVDQPWPNVNYLEDLKSHLDQCISDNYRSDILWSAMAQFGDPTFTLSQDSTLDSFYAQLEGMSSARAAAAITNPPVTQWFRENWWQKVNIIAMDFLPSSGIVEAVIEANIAKNSCRDDA